ncbi:DUF6311 domain-containing protein [Asticcacaulis sp.]|uniref:DUF6311 domain-containing protein n=1 Tax=Asticcacaulis sp. TaxID=1872648 RepID=UPI00260441CC|nr:DUF6311 domain-containing protein [Asticcacaulis sp.]
MKLFYMRIYCIIILLILPFIIFFNFFHLEILDPRNVYWVMKDDWGQHALGWHAYQHGGGGRLNSHTLLAYPTGLSIIYTDSNPLFAFLFKPFVEFLPDNFQYIGLWFLLCVILQVYVGWLLLRPHTENRCLALAGTVLLSLLPTLYHRMGHDTLMAHWLILLAIWIYFNFESKYRPVLWAGLMGLCGLVHPYILVMVAIIWLADVWQGAEPGLKRGDWLGLRNVVSINLLVLLVPISTLAIAGAYSGQNAGDGGFGYYSMGLDAPFNPFWPQVSSIFKAHPVDDGQTAEGFQYLGAGVLFLLASALIIHRMEGRAHDFSFRARGLLWVMALLILLALSRRIQIYNHRLINLPLPDFVEPAFSIIRASGRLFWPVAYILVWMALRVLFASRTKWAPRIVALAVVLQVVDLSGFAAFERFRTREASELRTFAVTPDPRWSKIIQSAKQVDFYPPNVHINDRVFYEIAWRAVTNRIPVSTMYAARRDPKQDQLEDRARRAFQDGNRDPTHLYVLINRCNAPDGLQSKVRVIDGVAVLPPDAVSMDLGDAPAPTLYSMGENLYFGWKDFGSCLTHQGFSMADQEVTRSVLIDSRIGFDLSAPVNRRAVLELELQGNKNPSAISVNINDVYAGELQLTRGRNNYHIPLPSSTLGAEHIKIDISVISNRDVSKMKERFFYSLYRLRLGYSHQNEIGAPRPNEAGPGSLGV